MSLLPDSASFHEQVEALFVAYRGHGVSLSANDVELVDAWAATGVPVEVVSRGLRKAAEAALWDAVEGEARLRSLRGARKQVEAEIAKYVKATAGRTEDATEVAEPFELTRFKKLITVLKRVAKEHAVTAPVLAKVSALPPPGDFEAADRLEATALALLLRTLPWPERLALLKAARTQSRCEDMTATARRESLRFHRGAQARHRFEVPSFW